MVQAIRMGQRLLAGNKRIQANRCPSRAHTYTLITKEKGQLMDRVEQLGAEVMTLALKILDEGGNQQTDNQRIDQIIKEIGGNRRELFINAEQRRKRGNQ